MKKINSEVVEKNKKSKQNNSKKKSGKSKQKDYEHNRNITVKKQKNIKKKDKKEIQKIISEKVQNKNIALDVNEEQTIIIEPKVDPKSSISDEKNSEKIQGKPLIFRFIDVCRKYNLKRLMIRCHILSPIIDYFNEKKEYNNYQIIAKLFLKYAILCWYIVLVLNRFINQNIFSFVQMTFSNSVWLWLRFMLFGLPTELLVLSILSLSECQKGYFKENLQKLYTASSERLLLIVGLFFISLLLLQVNIAVSLAWVFSSIVFDIILLLYAYQKVILNISYFKRSLILFLCSFLSLLFLYFLFQIFCTDMIRIFMVLFE